MKLHQDSDPYPRHIAIIMDGNRRWEQQNHQFFLGHSRGIQSVQSTVKACMELGIPYLTLFAFSTENWKRPLQEVSLLQKLIGEALIAYGCAMQKEGIRLHIIGDLAPFSLELQEQLHMIQENTTMGSKLHLTLALNYGSRDEILRAIKNIVRAVQAGEQIVDQLSVDSMNRYLDTSFLPDLDLMIRTAGECRLSNFLLWQSVYAEFYTTPVLWPDFTGDDLKEACRYYQSCRRKVGK